MRTNLIGRADKGDPLSADDHDTNLVRLGGFDTLTALLADTATYPFYAEGETIETHREGFRYRVAGSGATDHHLATAGGVKLYVLPMDDGSLNFRAFAPAADNSTNDYAKLRMAVNATPSGGKLVIPPGNYVIGQTMFFKRAIHLQGTGGSGMEGGYSTFLKFPVDVEGLKFEAANTLDGEVWLFRASTASLVSSSYVYAGSPQITVGSRHYITNEGIAYIALPSDATEYDIITGGGVKFAISDISGLPVPPTNTGADGSTVEGLFLQGVLGSNPLAHGIRAVVRIIVRNCQVRAFSGDGIRIAAGTNVCDPPGPGHPNCGNVNCAMIYTTVTSRNGQNGLYVAGYDGNACLFSGVDASLNGRFGIVDGSFLGNTYIGCHTAHNGTPVASANAAHQSACVSYGGRRYQANPASTEQLYVDTVPGTNETVWMDIGSGGVHQLYPLWVAESPVGTYFRGGSYYATTAANRSIFLGCYSEEGSGPSVMTAPAIVMGGFHGPGFSRGGEVRGSGGGGLIPTQLLAARTQGGQESEVRIPGLPDSAVLSWANPAVDGAFSSGAWSLMLHPGTNRKAWVIARNHHENYVCYITHASTDMAFGTGAPIPYLMGFDIMALGDGGDARRHTTRTAMPTTGTWARGDIVWNRDPSAGGVAGWMCTTAGTDTAAKWSPIALGAEI